MFTFSIFFSYLRWLQLHEERKGEPWEMGQNKNTERNQLRPSQQLYNGNSVINIVFRITFIKIIVLIFYVEDEIDDFE